MTQTARSQIRRITFLAHKADHRASIINIAVSRPNSGNNHFRAIGTANRLYRRWFRGYL
jgi:hypothetical protein